VLQMGSNFNALYVDGIKVPLTYGWYGSETTGNTMWMGMTQFRMGHQIGSAYYFTGSIDDVYIYDRVLSPTEVQALYGNSGVTAYVVSTVVSGNGTVTSSPTGIACVSTCSANFSIGSSVRLAAVPKPGYSFSGWSGACAGTDICTVTVDAVKSVRAEFVATQSEDACTGTSSNRVGLTVVSSANKQYGDSLEVNYCLRSFNSATKFDIYIAVAIPPDGTLLFAQSWGFFGESAFSYEVAPFLANTLIADTTKPVLSIPVLPLGLPAGAYTFYLVPVIAGADVYDQRNWVGSLAQGTFTLSK